MSLSQHLQPSNTLAAKSTAHNAFLRFLREEGMPIDDVHGAIERSGRGLAVVMDKIAIYLAFGDGTRGAKLAMNTVNSYFGHVKLWLLSTYPNLRPSIESELQVVGARLSKYCKKRDGGMVVSKAPACRKDDLQGLLHYIYTNAASASDYLDGLLINWLWYLFGRSSDIRGLRLANISVYPGGALCVRFTRHKTAEECGLTLFRDKSSFETCPILALAVALAMKTDKDPGLFNQLPPIADYVDDDRDLLSIPLRDLLNEDNGQALLQARPLARVAGVASPAVHAYVNRLLQTMRQHTCNAGAQAELSSHSFRRGGAQHANGNPKLSIQWILDRGSWSMSATNKGFAYVVNTTQEEQCVSKYLSGWDADACISHLDLTVFETAVQSKIHELVRVLFSGCEMPDPRVTDILMASIVFHYPSLHAVQINKHRGFIARLHESMRFCGVVESEFIAWHTFLANMQEAPARRVSQGSHTLMKTAPGIKLPENAKTSSGSSSDRVVALLMEQNRMLAQRLHQVERLLEANGMKLDADSMDRVGEPSRVRKAARKSLRDVWVEWRTVMPPRWGPSSSLTRQEKHEFKLAVAYMCLFLEDGYTLDQKSKNFTAEVMRLGDLAQAGLLHFLRDGHISANSLGPIVKAMRELYTHGHLDDLIHRHTQLVHAGRVVDHLPGGLQADAVLPPIKSVVRTV